MWDHLFGQGGATQNIAAVGDWLVDAGAEGQEAMKEGVDVNGGLAEVGGEEDVGRARPIQICPVTSKNHTFLAAGERNKRVTVRKIQTVAVQLEVSII